MKESSTENNLFSSLVDRIRQGYEPHQAAAQLYDNLDESERFNLLDGDVYYWTGRLNIIKNGYNAKPFVMGAIPRLGIPGIRFVDGPRGCVAGTGTTFPVSMARGATWNTELEYRVGLAIGEEVREQKGNFFGGICINLPRHPAWGRIQETYSDQPILLGCMGAAITKGVRQHVMACVKHFACNSMENARFKVDVTVDDADFHEVYSPHFRRVLQAGADAVMMAYNSVNGQYCGQNPWLINQILRQEWGFKGIVVSDFVWGIRDVPASIHAGLDIEEPFHQQRYTELKEDMHSGKVNPSEIRALGLHILETQLRFYAQRRSAKPIGTMASVSHRKLALTVAEQAMVLLKNNDADSPYIKNLNMSPAHDSESKRKAALPLEPSKISHLLILGSLADREVTGDEGSSRVRSPYVITPLQGIKEVFGSQKIEHYPGHDLTIAAQKASNSDAAVVIVGYTANDEGEYLKSVVSPDMLPLLPKPVTKEERKDQEACQEFMKEGMSTFGTNAEGGDRTDLHLHQDDINLIKAVSKANPRTIVVLVGAGAILMNEWVNEPAAIILSWYAGMEGGRALARLLSGQVDPSGRLPYAIPANEDDLPEVDFNADQTTYTRWYGQRLIQKRGSKALYPLGYGLSYQDYGIKDIRLLFVNREKKEASIEVSVQNKGVCEGRHIVQVYGTLLKGDRAGERELLGFSSVKIPGKDTARVRIELDMSAIGRWNREVQSLVLPQGTVRIEAASFWGDPDASTMEVEL